MEPPAPTVTIVFLVFNRREELRVSLRAMLDDPDPAAGGVDVIVVDNASEDGSAEMVAREFPGVKLIRREENVGVSGWNDGFAAATGDWVLALDDDCYLPPGGLRRALEAARERAADLVSFSVVSHLDATHRFDHDYRTGLLTFWGCAVLVRREVLEELRGYDPEIFVWANELEFMFRFFDRGYTHLHLPEVVAVHMKKADPAHLAPADSPAYLVNARHFAYIAAKHMRARDSAEALLALLSAFARAAVREDRRALRAVPVIARGFRHGMRHRAPVANAAVSRTYRRAFHSYASPWWLVRRPREWITVPLARLRSRPAPAGRHPGRIDEYFAARAPLYPATAATLAFDPARGPLVAGGAAPAR